MKNLIAFLSILGFWSNLAVAMDYGQTLEKYCVCRAGFAPGTSTVNYETTKYKNCSDSEVKPAMEEFPETYILVLNAKLKDNKITSLCSESESKEWYKIYYKQAKAEMEELEEEVKINVCGKNETNKSSNFQVKKCVKSFEDLLADISDSVFHSCDNTLLNKKKRNINRCVKTNMYRAILSTHKLSYVSGMCPQEDEEAAKACRDKVRAAILATQGAETKTCGESSKFHTNEAKKVCIEFLIDRDISFLTDSDKEKLGKCLMAASSKDAKIDCLLKSKGTVDDEVALKEIKDKLCAHESSETGEKACLNNILSENMLTEVSEECKKKAAKGDGVDLDYLAKCQRDETYKRILDNEVLSVYDCWNREKEELQDPVKRQECTVTADAVLAKIKACEQKPTPEEKTACFQAIPEQDMVAFYLANKAKKEGKDITSCVGDVACIAGMIYNPQSIAGTGTTGFNGTTGNNGTTGLSGTTGNNGTIGLNGTTGNNGTNNLGTGAVIGGAGLTAGGVTLSSSSGEANAPGGSGMVDQHKLAAADEGNGWFSFFKDVKMMKDYKRATNPHCRELHSAAKTRVIGTVASAGIVVGTSIAVAAMINKNKKKKVEDRDKKLPYKATVMGVAAVGTGLLIKVATNKIAKRKINSAIVGLTEDLKNSPTGQVDCGIAPVKSKTTHYIFPSLETDSKYLDSAISQIQNSKNPLDAFLVYNEWDIFFSGHESFDAAALFDEEELMGEFPEEVTSELKNVMISFVEESYNTVIPSAMADDKPDDGGVNWQAMLPQIMEMAPLVMQMSEDKKDKEEGEAGADQDHITRAYLAAKDIDSDDSQLSKAIPKNNQDKKIAEVILASQTKKGESSD